MGRDTLTIADVALGVRWFRAPVAYAPSVEFGVDRANRIIHGLAVVTKGEALGHNLLLDETFLDAVVQQGNRTKTGVKSRFDHPNASGSSMGMMLGRIKQLRRDGDVVRGDLHLLETASKTPDGDLAGYVMDLAEEAPEMFGASIVFTGDELAQKDAEGKLMPETPKIARLKKLMAADVVDQPAANPGGMFSVEQSLAAKATEFLDRYFAHMHKEVEMTKEKVVVATETVAESIPPVTAREFALANPEMYQEIFNAGVESEHLRIVGIQAAMFAGQEQLAKELIANGATVEDAKDAMIASEKAANKARLEQLSAAAPKTAGGGHDLGLHTDLSALPDEERWQHEYTKTPSLRIEFASLGAYQAYMAAEKNGLVKILNKGKEDR